ncbi:MAG TPA: hypothetical protein VM032_04610 [Vicinamibacterales bacterium]|nr:hypothetical protein [Vicinamibacterales bacterium]
MALFSERTYPVPFWFARSNPQRRRRLTAVFAIAALLYASATVVRVIGRKYYLFLPSYLAWTLTPAPVVDGPTHLLVLFADHFEPNRQASVASHWMLKYGALAQRHRDASGRPPQHTWFYPAEQYEPAIMSTLHDAMTRGLGEVEFHFHHDYDTAESLRPRMEEGLHRFAAYGFNRTVDGQTRFAFVHGNFGLDNSNGPFYCGVPTEIALLRDLGAFADFTFPSIYQDSQPPVVNQIYAARDDERPKSYDRPLPLSALRTGEADLMIFEGPLAFVPTLNARRLFLELDNGDVHASMPASSRRVDTWVRANIHVPQRPEWVFIKMFGHGAESADDIEAVTGGAFDEMLSYLEDQYNDGRRYVLHYVTAREAYNVAMAAADGRTGDPTAYLDYEVKPYVASAPR